LVFLVFGRPIARLNLRVAGLLVHGGADAQRRAARLAAAV
jgi:hypothetical protein